MQVPDENFIQAAISLSREGMNKGIGGPFGCVIVKDNQVIAEGVNKVTSTNDPTAHAEIVAIRLACQLLQTHQLTGCDIYTSCEPCPMCLGAIYWARPQRIIYAATRQDAAEAGFDDDFIYKEIVLPFEDRLIPTLSINRIAGKKVFDEWKGKQDKLPY
jgi:tRNA(Arg) A34 adenosine deaminase TadA